MDSYRQNSENANAYISQIIFISTEEGEQRTPMSFTLSDYNLEPKGFLAAVQQWMVWINMEGDMFWSSEAAASAGAMAMAFQTEVC